MANKLALFNKNASGTYENHSQCMQTVKNSSLPASCFEKADILSGDVL